MQRDHWSLTPYTPQSTPLYFWAYVQCGETDENKERTAPHRKETNNMVCIPTPSEGSDQLKSQSNGIRAFVVFMKTF